MQCRQVCGSWVRKAPRGAGGACLYVLLCLHYYIYVEEISDMRDGSTCHAAAKEHPEPNETVHREIVPYKEEREMPSSGRAAGNGTSGVGVGCT